MKIKRRLFAIAIGSTIVASQALINGKHLPAGFAFGGERLLIDRDTLHDVSAPLRSLQAEPEATESAPVQNPSPSPTPPDMTTPAGAAAIEQRAQGNRPPAKVVANFDGLGAGFQRAARHGDSPKSI